MVGRLLMSQVLKRKINALCILTSFLDFRTGFLTFFSKKDDYVMMRCLTMSICHFEPVC